MKNTASLHALGIDKGASGRKKVVMAELEKSYMLDCESVWEWEWLRLIDKQNI